MEQLEHLSFKGQKALFARLEELARIANMNKKERAEYEAALKITGIMRMLLRRQGEKESKSVKGEAWKKAERKDGKKAVQKAY